MPQKSQLLSEIYEQPEAIRRMLETEAERVKQIRRQLAPRSFAYILLAARGTSDNAARYGQYILGALDRLPVALAAPSLFTRYRTPPRLTDALVIGISQSGQSPDIVCVLEEGRRQGAPTIAITNDLDSPLAKTAELSIALGVGKETSVAATKTYTAQLTAMALLALCLKGSPVQLELLESIPAAMSEALESEPQAQEAAKTLAYSDHAIFIGRGFNYSTTHEIALKCKELANIQAEPYSSADFQHGPIAIVDKNFPVSLISIGETFREELDELGKTLRSRGARLVTFGDEPLAGQAAGQDMFIRVPKSVPEWLSPIPAIVPGQLLAYHLTIARGFNPDQPRAIQKVTLTE
jgi:glucosamine--fructose-6-phosphate aminotransferase (isomerizing)